MSWNGATWKSVRKPIASMFFFHSVCTSRVTPPVRSDILIVSRDFAVRRPCDSRPRRACRSRSGRGSAFAVAGSYSDFAGSVGIVAASAGRNELVRAGIAWPA